MKTLEIYPTSINPRHIDIAADALRRGELILYPTDSLYALGCDALNNRAIEQICRLKDIDPRRQNLSIICDDFSRASRYARIDNRAFNIMKNNLPGPFTIILPAATTLPKIFKNRRTVGIRIPDNPIAIALVKALDGPLLSTSANDPEMTGAAEIADAYRHVAAIAIDGGESRPAPSTVVDLTDSSDPVIVRQGLGRLVI